MRCGEGLLIRHVARQGRSALCPSEATSVVVNNFNHLCVICNASHSFEIESLNHVKLWNLKKIYGRRTYDPEKFSNYDQRNGTRLPGPLKFVNLNPVTHALVFVWRISHDRLR